MFQLLQQLFGECVQFWGTVDQQFVLIVVDGDVGMCGIGPGEFCEHALRFGGSTGSDGVSAERVGILCCEAVSQRCGDQREQRGQQQ